MIEFSIVIPVYNAEKYLAPCLESLINQSAPHGDYEVILVDDGSTDSSPEICDRYSEQYGFISVFHRPNSGPLFSRRFGLSKATGTWIIYVDADDLLKPETLSVLHEKTVEYPSVDCIIIGFDRLSGDKVLPVTDGMVDSDTVITDKREILRTVFLEANYNVIWRKIAKRETTGLDDFSMYYDIRFGEDQIQSMEILRHCTSFLLIPESLYLYRINEQGLTWTHDYSGKKISYRREQMILDFLRSENVFTKEDYNDYRSFLCGWLSINLVEIVVSKTRLRKKLDLFRQYSDNEFFKSFLSYDNRRTVRLLKERHYFRLMFYCIIKKAGSVIRHRPLSFF